MAFLGQLIYLLFIGFGFFVLATSFVHFKSEKKNELVNGLTESATVVVRIAAICYVLVWLTYFYESFQSEEEYRALMNRATGPYWYGYWIFPVCYGIFPQIFWVPKFRRVKAIRVVIALLLLFTLGINRVVILATSFHRDYVPGSWVMPTQYFFVRDWFVGVVAFGVALVLVYGVKVKMRRDL